MDHEGNVLDIKTEETKDLEKQVVEGIASLKVTEAVKEDKDKLGPGEDKHEGEGLQVPDDHFAPLVRVSHLSAYRHRLEEEINESLRRTDLATVVTEYFRNSMKLKLKATQRLLGLARMVLQTIYYVPADFMNETFLGSEWFDKPKENFKKEEMGMELKDIFFFDMGILPDDELQREVLNTISAIASLTTMIEVRFYPSVFKFLNSEVSLFVYLERLEVYSIAKLTCQFEEGQPKIERYCELLTRFCDWILGHFGNCGNEYILAIQDEKEEMEETEEKI